MGCGGGAGVGVSVGLGWAVSPHQQPLQTSRDLGRAEPGAWVALKPRLLNRGLPSALAPAARSESESWRATGLLPVPCRTACLEPQQRKAGSANALHGDVDHEIGSYTGRSAWLGVCVRVSLCAHAHACRQVETLALLGPSCRLSGMQSSRSSESALWEFSRIPDSSPANGDQGRPLSCACCLHPHR